MSGFALVFSRNKSPIAPEILDKMMSRIAHRGLDGKDTLNQSTVAMGHQHFWVTPEEVGERQPLTDAEDRYSILFDGRLDNRRELLDDLGIAPADGQALSDAALTLRAYQEWGEACFGRLLGPFALVIFDRPNQRLVCARDALGDRTLFYYADRQVFVVASEANAVLAHPQVSDDLNETTVILYLAVRFPEDGSTFFADVRELVPAHAMIVDAEKMSTWRYWEPATNWLSYRSDDDYVEQYRALFAESVKCRLRTHGRPAIMMSGGLDSTSVAAVAAQELAGAENREPLTTVSFVFDELVECDERPNINAITARYHTKAIHIPADDAWPLRDFDTWPLNPNNPEGNPYRLLKERVYHRASEAGVRSLLTGGFSDHLYSGEENWLADLLAERRFSEAGGEMRRHIRQRGLGEVMVRSDVRRVAGRLLERFPGFRRLRPYNIDSERPWLTPYALQKLPPVDSNRPYYARARRPEQVKSATGASAAWNSSVEIYHAVRHGLELRFPYRDRRLVEFMLNVPAHQLYNGGRYKPLLRRAMKGMLPEQIRNRKRATSLTPLYRRGIVEHESSTMETYLSRPEALWRPYVKEKWLMDVRSGKIQQLIDGPDTVVPWFCFSIEAWRRGNRIRNVA